jgi:hypothetical protein
VVLIIPASLLTLSAPQIVTKKGLLNELTEGHSYPYLLKPVDEIHDSRYDALLRAAYYSFYYVVSMLACLLFVNVLVFFVKLVLLF